MARFAQAAIAGGAAAIRANGADDIRAIRRVTAAPIIGIQKRTMEDGRILITPTIESARALIEAGADMVALDVTVRGRQYGALERMRQIRNECRVPVLADIATLEEAVVAAESGADFVLSTLRGYTPDTVHVDRFQPSFIEELVRSCSAPVIAEGRIHAPEEARQAIAAGAHAVVVGTAITRPSEIARSFAQAIENEFHTRTTTRFFAAVDLGGTATKFGIVDSNGQISEHGSTPTPALAGRQVLLDHLKRVSENVLATAMRAQVKISGLGLATAGWVNVHTGTVAYATDNLPGWTGTRLSEELRAHLHIPIAIENDANALAVAEKRFGAGRHLRDFVCITLGTGVGGGCFVAGRLHRGAHYFANALGHIPVVPDGLPCTCGQRGCLEVYCNSSALLRYAGPAFTSAEAVIDAAHRGDGTAAAALKTLTDYLALGCSVLVHLLDPSALIISGGLAQNNSLLFSHLSKKLATRVSAWNQRRLAILPSTLGYHGCVLGAAAVALETIDA
jgi:glucokinase-like ROK family protein